MGKKGENTYSMIHQRGKGERSGGRPHDGLHRRNVLGLNMEWDRNSKRVMNFS